MTNAPEGDLPSASRQIKGAKAYQTGLEAEKAVMAILRETGYTLLAHRYRTPFGEIDLVISDENWLIAIEVKQRRTLYESAFALGRRQAQRLLASFDYVINTHPDWIRTNTRIDLALVDQIGGIEFIEDALRLC
ncbi:YraN family protein [Acetobacteraceae bacterium ESL0709]|nr:YraN family protein [Acetobacteraceae bacterium ESL0697]MDF7677944.1 YraN family protein [Acetobacteraceae bacterium ESL0709]